MGQQFADVNVVDRVGLWYGQAYVMNKEHKCILFMAVRIPRDMVMRSVVNVVLIIHDRHLHDPKSSGSVHRIGNQKHTSFYITGMITEHVTHGACLECSEFGIYDVCSSSC